MNAICTRHVFHPNCVCNRGSLPHYVGELIALPNQGQKSGGNEIGKDGRSITTVDSSYPQKQNFLSKSVVLNYTYQRWNRVRIFDP